MKSAEPSAQTPADHAVSNDGGIQSVPAASQRDPYELLADLMVVVEEFCPTWPSRETFEGSRIFLL
jgi:hypothetical protein